MRLIDAESLKENLSKWLKQVDPTHPSDIPPMDDIIVSTIMTIEEEPTVDAIPIEWIENYLRNYRYMAPIEKNFVREMIKAWAERKEECGHQ